MKEAIAPPVPGRMPMIVPMMEDLSSRRQRLTMRSLAIAKAFTSENLSVMISILESESSRLSISAMAKKPTLMGMRSRPACRL